LTAASERAVTSAALEIEVGRDIRVRIAHASYFCATAAIKLWRPTP